MSAIPDRKFLSEFGVNLFSARRLMISAAELASGGEMPEESAEIADASHIYLICRRPNCSIDQNTFSWNGKEISGQVVYRVQGTPKSIAFSFAFPLLDDAVGVRVSASRRRPKNSGPLL